MSLKEYHRPPRLADRLLSWLSKNELFEGIQGDLHEYYERLEGPAWKNKLKYWYQVFNFLRPFALKNLVIFHNYFIIMTRSNLTISFRNIKKNFLFSLINIFGLGIALASCILIFQYLINEWSFDKFHPNHQNTFRITHEIAVDDNPVYSATTFSRVAAELKQSYPSITAICRLNQLKGNIMVDYKGKAFREEKVMGADSSFFTVFNFNFLYGNSSSAMKKGKSIVITKAIATKYFGNENPLGEELVIEGAFGFYTENGYFDKITYEVSGVLDDLPENTHLDFDFLISYNIYGNIEGQLANWGESFYTYLQIDDLNNITTISEGLPAIVEKYRPEQGIKLGVQPMQQIHLTSNLVDEIKRNGNEKITWLLALVVLIILIIAGTNYINFTLAKSFIRQKEIAIRKVFWAKKGHLVYQFLTEAFVINLLSLILGLVLIWASAPFLSAFLDFDPFARLNTAGIILICLSSLVLATLLSGIYPALHLSGIRLNKLIGSNTRQSQKGFYFRKFLIGFQYTVSILVIGCAVILYQQMKFIQEKDLGMDIKSTLVINGATFNQTSDSIYNSKLAIFKSEVLRLNSVNQITLANFIPGKNIRGEATGYVRKVGEPENRASSYYFTQIDYDFIPNFNFNVIAGRNFDVSFASDQLSVIINSEACRQLGFESPEKAIGQKINYRMNSTPTIIGVVDNFHQNSVKRNYQPVIFEVRQSPERYCYLKVSDMGDLSDIDKLSSIWEEIFPENPFSFFFLEDFYKRQYKADNRFMGTFTIFSMLAILVATLGIFGLTYFTAENRWKEIGIRKTLGANLWDICYILSKNLSLSILFAGIVGVPLTYLISQSWLLEYAFRIDISWWMLSIPISLLVVITFAIISLLSIRSFKLNPSILLREE